MQLEDVAATEVETNDLAAAAEEEELIVVQPVVAVGRDWV